MKKIINSLIIFILFALNSGAIFEIDAARNAMRHNNLGVNHMKENYYYGAIKEFEIAIQINPNSQASAIYYNNLGKAYMRIDYPDLAEKSFKEALRRNNGNLEYYQNIVKAYKAQNKLQSEYKKCMNDKKTTSVVMSGLILIEMGKVEAGINRLDEFCFDEPEMILTKGIKSYIQTVAPKELRF